MPPNSTPDRPSGTLLLTLDEVADELRVGRTTVDKLRRAGSLPVRYIGTAPRVARDALAAWFAALPVDGGA